MNRFRNSFRKHPGGKKQDPKASSSGSTLTSTSTELPDFTTQTLENQPYFHGMLPREEILVLLAKDGDYIVRESRKGGDINIVLSVRWGTNRHFIVQMEHDGKFRFEGPSFSSVPELIYFHSNRGIPVTEKSGAILKNAVRQQAWELKPDDIKLEKMLGKGNFGEVWRGQLKWKGDNNDKPEEIMYCAVKTCNLNMPEDERRNFLREARLMRGYTHPNVTRVIGVCAVRDPIMIVMELVPNGALICYLKKNRGRVTSFEKLNFSFHASAGMEYLESKKCIHRDLAARNCLLGEKNTLKIADFGMSRQATEYKSTGAKQIPIKWTAPEALHHGIYTSQSDVWSYGILLWEIYSDGGTPYAGMSNADVAQEILQGYRLTAPAGMPTVMRNLLTTCWDGDPAKRPTFKNLKDTLTEYVNKPG